ncbi:DUF58 domain-containing protein [Allorhizobium sp. BGMRC 0089]|uniref:DUF58 domain-containing protein n=1 Tax=Allorhizobium sonneratiae TaxID=2934936 RepID=UPI002034A27E|nr:DUF58 domain-containing protein [Allorhizobium sonneratiae]
MAAIGETLDHIPAREALVRARHHAGLIPDCLVEAKRIANTVIAGWHGRRKRGIGENFWQFRPYTEGESLARIDWRRSARDDQLYIRDREWEAAHTVWLSVDLSASMLYKSRFSPVSKEHRALVLMLALAEILSRSGERIGVPGLLEPIAARQGAERLALALTHALNSNRNLNGLPETGMIRQPSDIVLIGDFLDDADAMLARLAPMAKRGLRGHAIEVADPAEELFPYAGRTEFTDPETGDRLVSGRAETVAEAYRTAYLARRQTLASGLRRLGWSYTPHLTDRPASEALGAVHLSLSGAPQRHAMGGL